MSIFLTKDYEAIWHITQEAIPNFKIEQVIQISSYQNMGYYGYYDCGLLIGIALVAHYTDHTDLLLIVVRNVARRMGYGSALLKYITSKHKTIHVCFMQQMYLCDFYEKNGFVFKYATHADYGSVIHFKYN